jgi:hypothetical protein
MAEFKLGRIRFIWKGTWQPNTTYFRDDVIINGGISYICISGHESPGLFTTDQELRWNEIASGHDWKGDWSPNTYYKVNDVVVYGGRNYIANTAHTSEADTLIGLEGSFGFWDIFTNGIDYKGLWTPTTRYKVNDIVKYGSTLWICVTHHTSETDLIDSESSWAVFVNGLTVEGDWSSAVQYKIGDIVAYGGNNYVAITNNINQNPVTMTGEWRLFTKNFNFRNDWDIAENYNPGDVIRHGGYTYLALTQHTAQVPPNTSHWEQLNSGIDWKNTWTTGTTYILGDSVRYDNSSYICVQPHTSDTAINRPDNDINGNFWNLISGGPEETLITTEGDLIYYSQNAPTRLPIGLPGQILTVNNDGTLPEWKFVGQINHIYYVQVEDGEDSPAPVRGTSLDMPWKTIRYAAEQVEKGPLRPNAKKLLLVNRAFMQAETVEWIDYQVANNIAPFTTGFTYDKELSRRDAGLIIDALRHDISQDGNVRSREAALAYFDGVLSNVAGIETETVAAIEYLLTLIESVLNNTAPAANYQTLNSVTPVITQVIDNALQSEFDTLDVITPLVEIITDAITIGNTNSVPKAVKPNNTIFVKTGECVEVLPIIVPAECAIVGDELRSTRFSAAGILIDSADVPVSLSALERLQNIVSNIIQNIAITPTAGNTVTQNVTRPAGSVTAGTEAAGLIGTAISLIDFKINSIGTLPATTGSNDPRGSTEFTYAVEVLEANRSFILSEIEAFVAVTFPGYTYDITACLRDIDQYVNALQYDLIYEGNYKTILAATYYVNAVLGSTLENMFLMRNGTGLRNCTTKGLEGTLTAPNAFGTRRPTAGAYVSLDPGWGPNDQRAWISSRSPYIQNVSTFGTGCVGLKVDGSLHAGGFDSIVANDFTQLVSDGIGAWVTELARAELVSVFTYYNHIGYLAEAGGRIRATNGNNSYGDFGSVSEGIDTTEIPLTGEVDNRFFDAQIRRVFTNGNQILVFEYSNAGQNYTTGGATFNITGDGFGIDVNQSQVADGAVFEVRLLDHPTNPALQFGGDGFVTATNAAQTGDETTITLANTDSAQSGAYVGMAIYIISGRGAGQYGVIQSYNSGTKIAVIVKDSDGSPGWDHLIGSAIELSLDSTTTYRVEPRIIFSDPPGGGIKARGRAIVEDSKIITITMIQPGAGYLTTPTITFVDPSATFDPPYETRIGNGVLTQPTWTNRGTGVVAARATVDGDGFADIYQPGSLLRVKNLTGDPKPGANIELAGIPGQTFKLVFVRELIGPVDGPFTAELQISPRIEIFDAPEHEEVLEVRIRYSQVRLTGHDFLDIGSGNFTNTNYPGTPLLQPDSEKETVENNGGRVFYTSTDQDGNFRVGSLFSVEQSTGLATLDAQSFNLTGLQELSLGELGLGSSGTVITEFSTDGTFSANSDNIVPTQRAIKAYITSQIGGGAATLNVNSLTAGQIAISGQTITTTSNTAINFTETVNFVSGVAGVPVAMNYFLSK